MSQSHTVTPIGRPQTPETLAKARLLRPAILDLADRGEAGFFLQFGGQAAGYIEDLRRLYQDYPLLKPWIEEAVQAFQEEARHPESERLGLFNWGSDVLAWLTRPETTPAADYLASSVVSQALIFITQVAHFLHLHHYGCRWEDLRGHVRGVAGHSQGLMSAILLSASANEADLKKYFLEMVRYFTWQGIRMQQGYPTQTVPDELRQECSAHGWGAPSPMLAVQGLTPNELAPFLKEANARLDDTQRLTITLINGWRRLVVSGSPVGLVLLRRLLDQYEAKQKAKPYFQWHLKSEFLAVQGPYHSPHMQSALDAFRQDLKRLSFSIDKTLLKLPVFATDDGHDLRGAPDLPAELTRLQFVTPVDWTKACAFADRQHGVTHVVDFGPGEMASALTFINREGQGVVVLPYATAKGRDEFLSPDASAVRFAKTLWQDFAPRLVTLPDGTSTLDNAYVRFTGKPPIFGGGMTPTTVEADIVAAAANAGYLVEWAGGGQVTEAILRARTDELAKKLKAGEGFIFNALYLDSYLWGLHFPLVTKLKAEGYPIEGVTISAGVPTREKAAEILAAFKAAGLWCNAFKPGSDDQIRAVLEIADDHPHDTLLIQIEGGKAGGHHSWEDLYGLVERHYAAIRRRKNLVLCVGGGIASAAEAALWLNGHWHASGRVMPVDAVFLGTRLMAAKEAKTSDGVKKLLVSVAGTDEWVGRGEFKSGVTSGQSQLGADVHYAENAASRAAKWIDDLSQKDESEILSNKDALIEALATTAKPYFGDVGEMTYAQVLQRLKDFLAPGQMPAHIPANGVWFDISYRHRFRDFALRAWERLANQDCDLSFADAAFDDPDAFLRALTHRLPSLATEILHVEDVDYFFALCRRPGKPVNFVPVIDKGIKRWFKSDSLWQAHDPRYSADQVLTIPGTQAVKGIRQKDEPVAAIFAEYANAVADSVAKTSTASARVAFPGAAPVRKMSNCPVGLVESAKGKGLQFTVAAPIASSVWRDFLTSFGTGPIAAALQAGHLVWGMQKRDNAIWAALFPEVGARVEIQAQDEYIQALKFVAADGRGGVELIAKNKTLAATWHHSCPDGRVVSLTLNFAYNAHSGQAPLCADENEARTAIAAFYQKLWLGDVKTSTTKTENIWQAFASQEVVTPDLLNNFVAATSGITGSAQDVAPGLSIALLWRPLAQCLFQKNLGVDFLRLLHLSNRFDVTDGQSLRVGDTVTATVRLRGILNERQGRTLVVEGRLLRDGQNLLTLTTKFLIRVPSGEEVAIEENHFDETATLVLDEVLRRHLQAQSWFKLAAKAKLTDGAVELAISGWDRKRRDGIFESQTSGEVRQQGRVVAQILWQAKSQDVRANAVRYFSKRFAKIENDTPVKGGATFNATLVSPQNASAYALASFDLNPIHTDARVASLAALPQVLGRTTPIIHGMWTSAAALAVLQRAFPQAVLSWQTDFVGMVQPSEKLAVTARQVAARAGCKLWDVTVTGAREQTVLTGRAEMAQKPVAYLFTGQGSQVVGMGMAAYEHSPAAREMWDLADRYCQSELGFSILKVVRENPKTDYVMGEPVFHPKGILNLTQFAQVALTVLAMAQINELKAAGVYQSDAVFAGHSLGEYAALGCAGIIPLTSVIRVVYQRGLTMQNYVPRDAAGRSPYAMAVVRPKIVGLNEAALDKLVQKIASSGGGELYVVNYNIEGTQYSVTGRVELIKKLEHEFKVLEKARGVTKPSFIWIEGVDVPFHSPILMPGVDAFRKTLQETIPQEFAADVLIQRYIPNLNAEPFQIHKSYAKKLVELTGSPVLKKELPEWPDFAKVKDARLMTHYARLLLIELLAYQFASPVQWIRTQKALLTQFTPKLGRIVEVGPSAVLTNMMKATVLSENPTIPPEVLHFDSARDLIFGSVERDEAILEKSASTAVAVTPVVAQAATAAPAKTAAAGPAPADRPYDLGLALKSLLALKLNIRVDEIRDTETIEALSGGNSARRNEILSEIGAEFGAGAIDDAHQMPFAKLAEALSQKSSASAPGPVLQKAVDRALKEKVGLAKKDVLDHLANERLLPGGLQSSALALLPTLTRVGVSTRSGALSPIAIAERLTERTTALNWVDSLADAFGALLGIVIPHRQAAGAANESLVDSQALAELEDKYFGANSPFAKWAKEIAEWNHWSEKPEPVTGMADELAQLKIYKEAFGTAVERVATPLFDTSKVVSLRSSWNWVKRDALSWGASAIRDNRALSGVQIQSLQTRAVPEILPILTHLAKQAEAAKASMAAKSLQSLVKAMPKSLDKHASTAWHLHVTAPQVTLQDDGRIDYQEVTRPGAETGTKWLEQLLKTKAVQGDAVCVQSLKTAVQDGLTFAGQNALVTGAAPGSIAWDVVRQLLAGGARVVATTSSYSEERLLAFRKLYQEVATPTAELHILPFSQGSRADIEDLVRWCFAARLVPDILVPFAAVGESATLTMMTPDASTATLRVLLQGVEWLIASVAKNLRAIRAVNKPCLTLLPLSPNHGVFGGDGAYADAKLGLEALLNRWHSEQEDWGRYIALVGTTIGWVRGTGLMSGNNFLAATMETEAGVRTFSSAEAGFLLASLCCGEVRAAAKQKPLRAAFTGGFESVPNLARLATESRAALESEARLRRELKKLSAETQVSIQREHKPAPLPQVKAKPQNIFPDLPDSETLKNFVRPFSLDRDQTVVVVGYAEVSPFGSSRPRFEMECDGELSIAGAIELAWIMGLIRYEDGSGRGGYVGWADAKSGEALGDDQIVTRYRDTIRAGCGVRLTDTEIQGFDPQSVIVFGNIVLEDALTFTVEGEELAEAYRRHYGVAARIEKTATGFSVQLAKGAIVKVPRRTALTRWVAGQVPKGWEATRFGVPAEIATQIDRNTLYNLVASAEAFDSAGLTPDELQKTLKPALFANTQGGGMGGMTALNRMYHDLREDKPRQGDTLQETLINVGPAWVTQSLTGAYGPTVNPVAACATALVSLAVGQDLIQTGKAEFVVAGGYDDYSEEGVLGFQDMAATCDTAEMLARGFSPRSMSRPNDARRAGFVEAQGGGTVLLTSLTRALQLGLPIYGVLAFANNYSDGVHTSIPAPGLGLLAMAGGGKDSQIAQALKKLGLTADDITVVSKHDTSTAANDPNENKLHELVQTELGRTPGHALLVHSQKATLGHAKGGAGAWQTAAALQMLGTGRVPGNPNLEDVDPAMRDFATLCFSDQTVSLGQAGVRAVIATSLGFGHVGAVALFAHANFLLAKLSAKELAAYQAKRAQREIKAKRRRQRVLMGKETLFKPKKLRLSEKEETAKLLQKGAS